MSARRYLVRVIVRGRLCRGERVEWFADDAAMELSYRAMMAAHGYRVTRIMFGRPVIVEVE